MGLPQILINFKNNGATAIKRSSRGVVALIVKDSTSTKNTFVCNKLTDAESSEFTAANYDYIKLAFAAAPAKVIVERVAADAADYNEALKRLENKYFNYLAVPGIEAGKVADIMSFIKTARDNKKKTFKAVLPNAVGDHEGIINFATEGIVVGDKTYSASDYTARIAGLLAALPLSMSATYVTLPEVDSVTDTPNPGDAIDQGKLILLNDGEKVKLGRAVNSLATTGSKSAEFKKIKIVEAMDLIRDDIRSTFEEGYIGKVINNYDNKSLFVAAVNAYFKELARIDVLDSSYDNKVKIDQVATTIYLQGKGVDVESMKEEEIKKANTGSQVFVCGDVRLVDAMEDLTFDINM